MGPEARPGPSRSHTGSQQSLDSARSAPGPCAPPQRPIGGHSASAWAGPQAPLFSLLVACPALCPLGQDLPAPCPPPPPIHLPVHFCFQCNAPPQALPPPLPPRLHQPTPSRLNPHGAPTAAMPCGSELGRKHFSTVFPPPQGGGPLPSPPLSHLHPLIPAWLLPSARCLAALPHHPAA